ncbi:MAG: STAS domain-containing protein [Candidatus Omnitrophica bacterium]|nr:STAS domain-containing protein [Candidatus Omnitrophota bacterium]MCA9429816.1 STAS domain-containing protein [Candidatus Omnitrophota bacterium]MCA9443425.1 STAS domain-containing protein [Candidatus Omnitrophota bacterium]MCA9445659.1 STAS domain-containing protein [Candidatus Omnitrophota bacterium]MCB9767895.1 STAS domain-containing protein [Candidatus Omnitrophota bacterium]
MKTSSRVQDGIRIVEVDGQLDASCVADFRESFLSEIENDSKVVLDCSNLQYLDSSGLATLLNIHKNLAARDAKMILCGLSEGILRVITFTKLDKVLQLTDTLEDATQTLKAN